MKDTPMTNSHTLDAQAELNTLLQTLYKERDVLREQMLNARQSEGMGDQTEAKIHIERLNNHIQSVLHRLAALKTDVQSARFVCKDEDGQERVFTLVHPELTDAAKGFVSPTSPIGRALRYAEPGDSVTVRTPKGMMELFVVSVERNV